MRKAEFWKWAQLHVGCGLVRLTASPPASMVMYCEPLTVVQRRGSHCFPDVILTPLRWKV